MILLFGVPMFVVCCAILWFYWDRFKKPKKKIFISADCWLCVFDLLEPSQLGLGIAMISHRFDFYVDEHFKTRKWTLKFMEIWCKVGTMEMEIINSAWKSTQIPQNPLPKKVVGFDYISIEYIDRNTIAFLHRFRPLFAACPINLFIWAKNDRISKFIFRNIWPMFGKNIHGIELSVRIFRRLRQFVPSILNDCPSLRFVSFAEDNFFAEFPCDDSAAASDGQAVAKWLFTAHPNNMPKVLNCLLDTDDVKWSSKIAAFKAAFLDASSPVNFIVVISFRSSFADSVVPFALINALTREQLALKRINNSHRFLLVRCPIAREVSKWTKWEKEAIGWRIYNQRNRIYIEIYNEDDIGEGLIDEIPDPSVLQ